MKKNRYCKVIKVILGIIISLVAIYFTSVSLRGLSFELIENASLNIPLIVFSAILFVLSTVARSFSLCEGIADEMGFLESWIVVGIGNALNMVLPLHAGEGIRLLIFPKRVTIKKRTEYVLIPGTFDMFFMAIISFISTFFCDSFIATTIISQL